LDDLTLISSGLQLNEDGIWRAKNISQISYPANGNEASSAIEEDSFWFNHRNTCIATIVANHPPRNGGSIFDIGGGNGYVSLGLQRAGFCTTLVEPGYTGCQTAKLRGIENVVCATTETAGFKKHSMPAVGLFDVIEHIEDDVAFLKSLHGKMIAGGRLYATVPAYSALWSQEDVVAGHFRRYTLQSFSRILATAGFEVEFATYIFRFLPIPIILLRSLPYRLGFSRKESSSRKNGRDHAADNSRINAWLSSLLRSESKNIRENKRMHFGGSCLVVANSI
jgi:2-polyprenyl-3-methyl-5-hydroxy-6-metoxy-1,4-benzoquinol methylase